MYFPYLRGKQFELVLLRENTDLLKNCKNIHPIIEPVKKDYNSLSRAIKALHDNNICFTVIVNPCVGSVEYNIPEELEKSVGNSELMHFGLVIKADSDIEDIYSIISKWEKFNFTIIHDGFLDGQVLSEKIKDLSNIKYHVFIEGSGGKLYQNYFKNNNAQRILIRDGFNVKPNKHYPPNEHFSDLHITYPDEGMDGFGDYLIVGKDYSDTGGPAYAIAIHLTYCSPSNNDMFIMHFKSNQTDSPTNPGGKFLEALKKLVKEINLPSSSIFYSKACKEYQKLYDTSHYPGLGYVKKLSMQHHLELISNYLENAN